MSRKSFPFRSTGGDLRDLDQPGYYCGFSTMAQKKSWDEATQDVVSERIEKIPPIRFFSPEEAAVLDAVIDRVLPQDDRSEERTIPILPVVDERLYNNSLNGFRYEDMPPDQEAYRLGIKAIDDMARSRYGQPFVELTVHRQELLLQIFARWKARSGTCGVETDAGASILGFVDGRLRHCVLLASLGLGRDRIWRACVSTRIHAA